MASKEKEATVSEILSECSLVDFGMSRSSRVIFLIRSSENYACRYYFAICSLTSHPVSVENFERTRRRYTAVGLPPVLLLLPSNTDFLVNSRSRAGTFFCAQKSHQSKLTAVASHLYTLSSYNTTTLFVSPRSAVSLSTPSRTWRAKH